MTEESYRPEPLLLRELPLFALVGSFLRLALAIFSSSSSLMDLTILRDAPFRLDLDFSPRLAARAAPAFHFFPLPWGEGGEQSEPGEGLQTLVGANPLTPTLSPTGRGRRRACVSKHEATWFETRSYAALLTMRLDIRQQGRA